MNQFVTREHEDEPVPGLPGRLPDGERIIWQGRPEARLVARRSLKVRWIGFYFLLLALWAVIAGLNDGYTLGGIFFSAGVLVLLATIVVAMLEFFAWGVQKTTVYTITNRRVVMRFGVALSMTLNLPFNQIESAAMKKEKDGSGSLALSIKGDHRLSWLVQWPHVRGWRLKRTEPAMIGLMNVEHVANVLAQEMALSQPIRKEAGAPAQGRKLRPVAPVAVPAE